jgi:hypothetical protein
MVRLSEVLRWARSWSDGRPGDAGQGLVECALLIMLIAIVCVVAVTAVGQAILTQLYDVIARGFPGF